MNSQTIKISGILLAIILAFGVGFSMPVVHAHADSGGDSGGGCCGGSSGSSGSGSSGGASGSGYNTYDYSPPTYSCPAGDTGTYPYCTPRVYQCPSGDTGTYPNCVAPTYSCPTGYTGTYPNCTAPTYSCPTGYTGTYPNCVAPTFSCPTGYTGTYPNCVAPTYSCPTGTTGTYPNCVYQTVNGGITINNTNTNTNTNTNSAPVSQVVNTGSTQQPVVYNYEYQTPSYNNSYSNSGYHYQNYGYNNTPIYTYPSSYYTPTYAYQNYNYTYPMNYSTSYPTVSLTQIPYTGFDFGTLGDTIYWLSIIAVAVSAAYLLVYYHGGTYAFASDLVRKVAVKLDEIRGSIIA